MGIDSIISSTGLTRAGLDSTVSEWQGLAFRMEHVLANYFDLEELVCAVEQLAARLDEIRGLASDQGGDLAERILAITDVDGIVIPPAGPSAAAIPGVVQPIYGYPPPPPGPVHQLRSGSAEGTYTDIVFHPATGASFAVP